MTFSSITFTKSTSDLLRGMKQRTQITPNLLARIGFCLSLREPNEPVFDDEPSEGSITIERRVLTGNYDQLLITLLRQRHPDISHDHDDDALNHLFKAHMHRGVELLNKQLKEITRLQFTLPKSVRETALNQ